MDTDKPSSEELLDWAMTLERGFRLEHSDYSRSWIFESQSLSQDGRGTTAITAMVDAYLKKKNKPKIALRIVATLTVPEDSGADFNILPSTEEDMADGILTRAKQFALPCVVTTKLMTQDEFDEETEPEVFAELEEV